MSAYNPNYVPPAHAPMPLNGNNMVNGLPGGVQQQQQQPGPPTGQPEINLTFKPSSQKAYNTHTAKLPNTLTQS